MITVNFLELNFLPGLAAGVVDLAGVPLFAGVLAFFAAVLPLLAGVAALVGVEVLDLTWVFPVLLCKQIIYKCTVTMLERV